MDKELKDRLRQAYNVKAAERDSRSVPDWRTNLRDNFANLLLQEKKQSLLELGAGPGRDGRYFQELGFEVLCTDLSPEMVRLCREKGLRAEVMDITNIKLPPASFDAVYAMNSLLHLPKKELPAVLQQIKTVLMPDGLFFMGVYGGIDREEIWEEDLYEPKRFFAFYTDDQLKQILLAYFDIHSFTVTENVGKGDDPHHQSVILRKST